PEVCSTPFGLPVDPDVYSMNSGDSASITSGGQSGEAEAMASWYQTSRSEYQWMSPPVRRTTTTFSTVSTPGCVRASSTLDLSGTVRPPRRPSSAVMTSFEPESMIRLARESGEKPPKTTECTRSEE